MILGIGIDLIEIERIKKSGVERLAKRILTQREQHALSTVSHRTLEVLAGRFVAKEAIAKALGCGIGKIFSFYDAEIFYDDDGKPQATITAEVLEQRYPEKEIGIHISITHSREYASAVAVIESK